MLLRGSGQAGSEGASLNFYPHHIGDYLTATVHLSWLEDAAYRRLLDVYYSRESAIPADIAQAARLVRATSKEERKAVETVLREFFTETLEGWKHKRCDAEIEKAKEAAERARKNGKKGGRPPIQKPAENPQITQPVISGNPEESKSQAPNPNPITKDSEAKASGGKPPMSPDEIIFGYGVPLLTSAGSTDKHARSFLGGLRKAHGDDAVVATLRECIRAKPLQPMEWLAAAMLPDASGASETRYQKAKREQMMRDFPNLFPQTQEVNHGPAIALG